MTETDRVRRRQIIEETWTQDASYIEPEVEVPGPGDIVVPLRIRHNGEELAFLGTVATFGTPLDITVAELVIESFFPADARTAAIVHRDELQRRTGPIVL